MGSDCPPSNTRKGGGERIQASWGAEESSTATCLYRQVQGGNLYASCKNKGPTDVQTGRGAEERTERWTMGPVGSRDFLCLGHHFTGGGSANSWASSSAGIHTQISVCPVILSLSFRDLLLPHSQSVGLNASLLVKHGRCL